MTIPVVCAICRRPLPDDNRSVCTSCVPDEKPSRDVLSALRYIADSPAREHGGFHGEAAVAARDAIAEIERLRAEIKELRADAKALFNVYLATIRQPRRDSP